MEATTQRKSQFRLESLSGGKSLTWLQRFKLLPVRIMSKKYPGPMVVMSHRKELAGKEFVRFLESSMRRANYWTQGETELMASFVAGQLQCKF
ncbi:MAG: hypothetical protein AAGA30_08970 [Planctomycetota bacterium]